MKRAIALRPYDRITNIYGCTGGGEPKANDVDIMSGGRGRRRENEDDAQAEAEFCRLFHVWNIEL